MRRLSLLSLLLPVLLAACGDGRPTYFGKQGPTEGMPGYVDGQKTNPNIKLGKPYRVGGKTYVPTYDPNYVEEGEASWYGPGFHGGKTANGEQFDKYDFTAAHTTLPLPSVVKVTNLQNGKFVYVRVNDRGPFAEDRIIDLSKAAAEQLDIVRRGTAHVRVEYMKDASERLVALMNTGRDPASIDIAHEIIPVTTAKVQVAEQRTEKPSWWEYLSPAPSAMAGEPATSAPAAVVDQVESREMPEALPVQQPSLATDAHSSPFDAVDQTSAAPTPIATPIATPNVQDPAYYVQLGSFSVKANAEVMRARFSGPVEIDEATGANGMPLYRVRMGPFTTAQEAATAIGNAQVHGVGDARVIKPH